MKPAINKRKNERWQDVRSSAVRPSSQRITRLPTYTIIATAMIYLILMNEFQPFDPAMTIPQ